MKLLAVERLETRALLSASATLSPPTEVSPLPEVPYFGDTRDWALNAVDAPEVWAHGHRGQDVVVAVIDSGIDLLHEELVDKIWANVDEIENNGVDDDGNGYVDDTNGWDFVERDAIPNDEAGHGTRVAGVLAASRNEIGSTGVAFDASIMPIRVLDKLGNGSQFHIAQAVRYAVDNGAHVINLSVGAAIGSQRLRSAISYAEQNDVLVVAAAGNGSNATPDYPAVYSREFSNVISVGAFDRDRNLGSFSNRVGNSGTIQIDAPGVSVYTTAMGGGTQFGTGTSFATPVVSGVAALMLSIAPGTSAADLRSTMLQTASAPAISSDSLGSVNAAAAAAQLFPNAIAPPQDVAAAVLPIPGDADEDGHVGMSDFLIVSSNYNQPGQFAWRDGDFNADGRVDFFDFMLLTRNFGDMGNAAEAAGQTTFPETSSASSLHGILAELP